MPLVKFTPNLKRFYPQLEPVASAKLSIPELIDEIDIRYPGIKNYILDEQNNLRKHVQIFIGEDLVRDRSGLSDKIGEKDEVYIMQALSGG